jgi:hypothetical protein
VAGIENRHLEFPTSRSGNEPGDARDRTVFAQIIPELAWMLSARALIPDGRSILTGRSAEDANLNDLRLLCNETLIRGLNIRVRD